MKPVQRQWEKLLRKGPGDDAQVSMILKDFDDAEKALSKIIDGAKGWRDSWVSIFTLQVAILNEYDTLYKPIPGAHDGRQDYVETPPDQVDRVLKLRESYVELKQEMLDEIGAIDSRLIGPAMDAKDSLQPLKKTIKKRDNKKLDMQRYQERVDSSMKKLQRSDRENASLAKAEQELAKAADDFQMVDAQVRENLPPIIKAVYSLLPRLLSAQIITQTTLLAQYYTILHNYCQDIGFPSPPPPMAEVIATWQASFHPVQHEVEGLQTIARGKAVQQPMSLGDEPPPKPASSPRPNLSSFGSSFGSNKQQENSNNNKGSRLRIPSYNSATSTQRIQSPSYDQPPEIPVHPSSYTSHSPSNQIPSSSHSTYGAQSAHSTGGSDYFSKAAISKKKPPPPPPSRKPSQPKFHYVTALYSFTGEGAGDLSFREGDQIRVIRKTDSTDDWWDGELDGRTGSFPANYCQ